MFNTKNGAGIKKTVSTALNHLASLIGNDIPNFNMHQGH